MRVAIEQASAIQRLIEPLVRIERDGIGEVEAAKFCRQILVEQVGRLEHMPVGIDDLKSISHDLAPFLLIVAVIAAATDRFTESVGCS